MKILVHDYAGHPFQVDLSRELARRGHCVTHAYFAEDAGPKGDFKVEQTEYGKLLFEPLKIGRVYDKNSFVSRRFSDIAYGRETKSLIERLNPDIVISGNTPTEAQDFIMSACQRTNSAFIHWLQDFYSIAASKILTRKLGLVGAVVGAYYRRLERRQLLYADAVVVIAEDFVPAAAAWAGDTGKVSVIENWGALDHISPGSKDNSWARQHGLADTFNFIYTGTIATKHNPELLIQLARSMRGRANIITVCQGNGVRELEAARADGLDNLIILPLQPFNALSSVLASADVVVAMIEHDAGTFSVPSKVQSYLCAARPVLLASPSSNLAARIVMRENAGLILDPLDMSGWLEAAQILLNDDDLRLQLGSNGRDYALKAYKIGAITDRFEAIMAHCLHRKI